VPSLKRVPARQSEFTGANHKKKERSRTAITLQNNAARVKVEKQVRHCTRKKVHNF